jgi:hypothetical protein
MDPGALSDMTCHQVRRQEQRLRERAKRIMAEVMTAKVDGFGRMWISRETGTDMTFEFEHWCTWVDLVKEMQRADARFVADLGPARVEHWHRALDEEVLRAPRPLRAYQPATPRVRHVEVPPSPAFRRPGDQAAG